MVNHTTTLILIQTPRRSRRSVFHIRRFGPHSRALGPIAMSKRGIRRRNVRGQGIRFLAKLSVAGRGLGLALPEFAFRRAGRVAVVGGGPEGFLALVVAGEGEFEEDGEEEEDAVVGQLSLVGFCLGVEGGRR